jgi:nitrite reductase/ring-hydroxylating ferredoxin subunit
VPADSDPSEDRTDSRHHVAAADELDPGDRLVVAVRGRELAVFNVDGDYYALSNYCTHQGGPACEGLLSGTVSVDENRELCWARDGEIVACPWHGWEFDVTNGEHLGSDRYRLPRYEVVVDDGDIYVEL